MDDLKTFISDNVVRVGPPYVAPTQPLIIMVQILGSSDHATVDYVQSLGTSLHALLISPADLATAMSSKTSGDLYTSLLSTGMTDSSSTQSFAAQVHSLVPRKIKLKAPKSAAQVSSRYAYVMEDEAGPSNGTSIRKEEKKKKKKDRDGDATVKFGRSSRKRDTEGNWEDDPEDIEQEAKRARILSPPREDGDGNGEVKVEETDAEREERERLEDLAERDAFAERMKDKDRDRTKKLVTDRSTKTEGGLEAEKRALLADDAEVRKTVIDDLRLHSRQEYLTKRESQRLDLLKLEIEDEKILFRNQKMSKRELAEFEKKKELIRIMEARQRIDDGTDGYMLPDDYITEQGRIDKKKRQNALYQRYEEGKPVDGQFVTDVDQWEASQTDKTNMKTGALDRELVEDAYEYVFDETQKIKFLQEGGLEGTLTAEAQALLDQVAQAEKKGESTSVTSGCC